MTGTLIGLGIAFLISLWVFNDAKSRGSSAPVLWAIGVFLLLIIFLPAYLLMRPSKKDVTLVKNAPQLCPHCGKYYEPPVTYCPHCGNKV
ncbi:MAG: hypothetical protein IKE46_01420 [Selenomonadaceae bacterium]|nr:hypothetical protein [Selenomonadaceae bacterium]MBR3745919.1 hypothetical protein [Selenomonadaceae bacterium]